MRRRTALMLLLGMALVGCNSGGGDSNKPIDPSLSQVTVKVDGMT